MCEAQRGTFDKVSPARSFESTGQWVTGFCRSAGGYEQPTPGSVELYADVIVGTQRRFENKRRVGDNDETFFDFAGVHQGIREPDHRTN